MAGVAAGDCSAGAGDGGLDFCVGGDQFPEQSGEGAEVEVADDRNGRVGNLDGDFRCFAGGVAEVAAAGEGPCVFADSEDQEPECQAGRQRLEQFLKNPGILTLRR